MSDSKSSRNAYPPKSTQQASGKPRQSVQGWGASGAPRASTTGQPRASQSGGPGAPRGSFRKSTRHSNRSQSGVEAERLQIVLDGVDRTPKPLLSINPTVLKGAPGDITTPNSETSEFFMDRMSGTAFTKGGWYSNADSGAHTPKSEAEYEYDENKRKSSAPDEAAGGPPPGVEDDTGAASGPGGGVGHVSKPKEEEPPAPPQLLTERDLERSVYLTLTETDTIFIMQVAGVTVALDTDEAKAVEEANRRYATLLHTKGATDKYVEAEAQTLGALKKSRDVQSAVSASRAVLVQATAWDIADTFRALDEAAADAEDEPRGGASAAAALPGNVSISQMAGGVAKYQGGGGGKGAHGDNASRATSVGGTSQSFMMRPSGYPAAGGGGQSMFGGPGSFMSGVGGHMSGMSTNALLPSGTPLEGGALAPPEPPNPLLGLGPGLQEALLLMDYAINQNNYLPQLLLYRDIQPLPGMRSSAMSAMHRQMSGLDDGDSDAMSHAGGRDRPLSAVPSDGGRSHGAESVARSLHAGAGARGGGHQGGAGGVTNLSRQPSERSVALTRALSMRESHAGQVPADARSARHSHGGGGGGIGGYAASVAESNWPEELLQELADLGDDAPRMEHLWEWSCALTAGKNVSCMAWNKANPDLLAVGYGSNSFASASNASASATSGTGNLAATGNGNAGAAGAAAAAAGAAGAATASGGAASAAAAAGAGAATATSTARGLVAFWSIKNLQHPLWWFEAKAAVTALDFSTYSPNMLAVGLYDGTVAIYDIKSKQGTPSVESDVHSGKHSDPVWKVKWLDHGPERDEPLVSISTDGRVTQWSIAKGLEFSDLMKLKRMARRANPAGPATSAAAAAAAAAAGKDGKGGTSAARAATLVPEQQDAFISRLTSGMAFDFSSRDERIYVAATEDGWLHKCSTSYSEQYLESYRGHLGPVYAVHFSPFKKDMFISASGDWTIRMWQEGRDTPLLTFQASATEINDVQWCPTNSTVFGSVTSNGRLEIWDFSLSTVKPVMHQKRQHKLSCLLFAPHYPVVVCGGEDGSVRAYRLFNVSHEYDTAPEQLERLDECIRANVMKSQGPASGV